MVVGKLADCHLAVDGAGEDPGSPEWCDVQALARHALGAVPAGHMRLRQPVGLPCGVAVLLDPLAPRQLARFLRGWFGRAQAMAHDMATESSVPAYESAEVGLEYQVDHRVIEGGGLGTDGRHRKRYGGDII